MELSSISVDGRQVSYFDAGSVESEPILLVHGFPLDYLMWAGQFQLATHYRILALDLPGFGHSDPLESAPSMKSYADAIAALLTTLGIERVTFCGLSMGGYIAWQWWEHYAHMTRRMIICDSKADADSAEVARGRKMMAEKVLVDGTEFVAEALIPKLFADADTTSLTIVQDTANVIRSTSPASIADAQRAMAAREDYTARLSSITCPLLLVCGEQDQITPPDAMRQIHRAVSDS